ncbi:ABC transporter permease [Haladaptatus salinisoli]|uniref:ABC transporter permease n=1 Tax=Haladaptatus salinisoli TaxID=2884876 RepID=UPI001D0AEF90|nr:ABC transporter permease [Haladaptatus salinisoli]
MSLAVVARKDFEDAARSKMLWAITALFVLTTAGGMYALNFLFDEQSATGAVQWLSAPASLVVPLAAIVVGYLAIAGERESGSIKILLGLPHTRRDVVLGKLVGRTGVVAVATVVAFAVGAVVLLVQYGSLPLVEFALLGLLTFFFAMVFVGIAIGFSAFTKTRSRAMAGAIGIFFLFQFLWSFVPVAIYYLLEGSIPNPFAEPLPAWYFLLQLLNPSNAYGAASGLFIDSAGTQSVVVGPSGETTTGAAPSLADLVQGGTVPFYLDEWFSLVILAAWLVVPVAIGYWRFRDADLS